ncbi:antibiotic biosynthesis monooxygenase family protein [Geodermatophilus chilensis]|jgi:heme-degrading monooxygenase HmoA|uniref:antibiotic biosynthesis monooxygenase family protein n=1 Tax=Geodermatophilus chilensis TaxID=2035835 RepID=UPI0018E42139
MMTVVTTAKLRSGAEAQWDSAMRERFESARNRPGWISGQLLTPDDDSSTRMIVGTWRTRTDWENWHHDPAFLEQRGPSNGSRRSRVVRSGSASSRTRTLRGEGGVLPRSAMALQVGISWRVVSDRSGTSAQPMGSPGTGTDHDLARRARPGRSGRPP